MNTKNSKTEQASRLFKQVRSVTSRCFVTLFALAVLLSAATTASAQISGTGSIQGTVLDSTGALIAGATVTLTNDATQVRHMVTSGRDGLYSFPNTDIGTYTLTVTSDGFKTYTQAHIVLEVSSSIGINVTLQVGSTTEKVEVQAAGIALQTEDASYKQTIDQTTLTELPLNGRNITALIQLTGATVPNSSLTEGNKGFYSSASPQIAGGQGNQTDYRLDGGDNNDYESNTSFAFPFPDAVAQFSLETSATGAQSGLHPAGVVNVVTRSGSNSWHGSAFNFMRNNIIDAKGFFSNNDSLHQNQFGGTFGGKIIRDRLFFFGGYQRTNYSAASTSISAKVPTQAMLQGNFLPSETAPCITTAPVQLFNPITGALLPNDAISPSFFNSASLALDGYLPPAVDDCGNTAKFSIPTFQTDNQYITRIDGTINPKHAVYGRFFRDGFITPALWNPKNALVTANPGNTEVAQALTIGETWTISSTFVNTVHLTGTRRTNTRGPAADGLNAASVGIPSSAVYQPYAIGFRVQGPGFTPYCSTCAKGTFNVNSWSIIDDANKVIGKHQIVFGGEFIRAQLNVNNSFSSNGTFNFSNVFSQKGPAQNITSIPLGTTITVGSSALTPIQGGNSLLDYLTGSMTTFSQSKPQQNAMRAPIPSLYIQDTYHATPRLVISGGLRWSAQFTPYDYFGRGSGFDYGMFNANQHSTRFPNAPAGSYFYGDAGIPKNFTKNYPWQFTPRLGVTFDPMGDGKTVFRAGGGLVFDETNFFASTETTQNAPFATLTTVTASTAPISFSNPWASYPGGNPYPQPFVPLTSQTFGSGGQYIVYPKEFPTPYTLQWTASIQHEIGRGWQFQIDYIANKSSHQPYGYPLNPIIYIPGTWTGVGSCTSPFGPLLTSPGTGKPCSSTGNSQARAMLTLQNPAQGPFYLGGGGGGASTIMVAGANARYDGMIATIQHRASKSFVFLANYTWSHCYDMLDNPGAFNTVAVQNPFNPKGDYAACGFDRRGIFNSSIVASTHFSSFTGWKSALINNWEIAPIIRATTGAPFTVTSGQDNSFTALNTDRPNFLGGNIYLHTHPNSSLGGLQNPNSLDVTKFVENPAGTYGNSPRNYFVGPKYFNIDTALSRSFPIHEQLAFTLRLEAFNTLNHPNFGNPAANVFSPTSFGRVSSAQAPRIFQFAGKITF